jgi:hypothetical protein
VLIAVSALNFEAKPVFRLSVSILDYSLKPPTSLLTTFDVNVTLVDRNDPPVLIRPSHAINITENVPVGTLVMKLPFLEEDTGDTGKSGSFATLKLPKSLRKSRFLILTIVSVTFSLLSQSAPVFVLDRNTGDLATATAVNFETLPRVVSCNISLTDDGRGSLQPPQTSYFVVNVTVGVVLT